MAGKKRWIGREWRIVGSGTSQKGYSLAGKSKDEEQHGNKVDKVRPVTRDRGNRAQEKCLRGRKGVVWVNQEEEGGGREGVRDVGLTRRRNRTTLSLSRNRRRSAERAQRVLRDGKEGGHGRKERVEKDERGGALPLYKLPKL